MSPTVDTSRERVSTGHNKKLHISAMSLVLFCYRESEKMTQSSLQSLDRLCRLPLK